MSHTAAEFDRRLANVVRVGTITALDAASALVRVSLGDGLITDWLPWLTHRAGPDRTWHAPEPGEQVVVLSPSGELDQGVVLPALYQDAHPEPANSADVHRTVYADGSVVEYDRAAHRLTVNVGSGSVVVNCATATVHASDSVTLDTPETQCTGNLTVAKALAVNNADGVAYPSTINGTLRVQGGDVLADEISLKHHKHPENDAGGPTGEAI